jgi:hypothetical protein
MTTREMIEVMEAYDRGEEIQCKESLNELDFIDVLVEPNWDWRTTEYRIKPKEKKMVKLETWLFQHNSHKDTYCETTVSDVKTVVGWNPIKLLETKEMEL